MADRAEHPLLTPVEMTLVAAPDGPDAWIDLEELARDREVRFAGPVGVPGGAARRLACAPHP